MVIADASGLPLALHTDSAGPHEVTLVQATLDEIVTVGQPRRIIGDRAYDSDPLDNALAAQGIEMIAPHRRNRKRKATQDGRPLRRYRRRWKIERLFAWLNTFKRTMARWDRFHQHFRACLETSAFIVTRRHVDKKRLCAAAKTREDCQTVPQRSDGQRMGACTSSPAPCFWRRSEAQNRPA